MPGDPERVLYTGLTRRTHNSGVPRIGAFVILLSVAVAAAAHARPAPAAGGDLLRTLFGAKMVRAEVIVQEGEGVRVLRVDRGRVRALGNRELRLLERDGTLLTIPVAPAASITSHGAQATFEMLKRGMNVTTVRDAERPAQYVVQPAQAWPKTLARMLFGQQLVRAEVILLDGTLRDVRLDHGQIVAVRRRVVRLRESDGRVVALPVAANARITLDGQRAPWSWLRPGMSATVVRDGEGAAWVVEASAAGR